ncbi:uncharacterized protein LOC119194653 isoform X1 [Pungitius pungitius]|uniref:uncharacterized protein LOC119194653 isoform X1 n=1 Tax=Pungitius pungitius TaxID=134920 RepID=UPI002E1297F6
MCSMIQCVCLLLSSDCFLFSTVVSSILRNNSDQIYKSFLSLRGNPIHSVTSDLFRLHTSYKVQNTTSQEVRRVAETEADSIFSASQKEGVARYMAHTTAVAQKHYRMLTAEAVVETSVLLAKLSEASQLEKTYEQDVRSSTKRYDEFTTLFPVMTDGMSPSKKRRTEAGFPNDRTRAEQYVKRKKHLLSRFTIRKPSVEKVGSYIAMEGWLTNCPAPDEISRMWKPASREAVEDYKIILRSVMTQRWNGVVLKHFRVVANKNFAKGDILCRGCRRRFLSHTAGSPIPQDHRIIPAYRRNKNLQDHLVKAKIKPLQHMRPKIQHNYFKHRKWFRSYSTREVFLNLTRGNIHCKNCVYLITCTQCGLQYVGETGNSISTRFTQHKYNITKKKKTQTPLVTHFITHGWKAVSVCVIEWNPRWSAPQRRRAERVWIARLKTRHPTGLNED